MGLEKIDKFGDFDPECEDFGTYVERLEQLFIVAETKTEHKAAVLITVIGRKAYGILKNLCLPDSPKDKSYEQLVELLRKHFSPVRITIAERFKFYRRNQRLGEPISEFVIDLKRLAATCNFGSFLNDALRDAFVCGLINENIQRKLLSEPDLSFDSACQIAYAMELASKETNKFHTRTVKNSPTTEEVHRLNFNVRSRPKQKGQTAVRRSEFQSTDCCKRCGRSAHKDSDCPARDWKCFSCKRRGHAAKMCRQKVKMVCDNPASKHFREIANEHASQQEGSASFNRAQCTTDKYEMSDSDREEFGNTLELNNIITVKSTQEPCMVNLQVENTILRMELDTGAGVSLIPDDLYRSKFPWIMIRPTKTKLKSVLGENLNVLGEISVRVRKQDSTTCVLTLLVVEGIFMPLLGRTWLNELQPDWKKLLLNNNISSIGDIRHHNETKGSEMQDTHPYVQELKSQFPNVFDGKAQEKITGFRAQIHIREGVKPIFLKAYPVPYALLSKVEEELQKLQDRGIIVPVTQSDWASPLVIVPKANSSQIRLCVDFKRSVNQVITTEHYPLPKIEDILATLAGGKLFTVLDLTSAYQQLEVAPESQSLLTINTHKGLFQYTRLPFGIASAPAIFQRVMDNILKGLPKTCCYLDDVLITGSDEDDLKSKLSQVMDRLARHNVKINSSKCRFMLTSVDYLGHQISADGIRPSSKNVEVILNSPSPANVSQLRSYLGMLNFYAKFIPNMASKINALNNLLKKSSPWNWSEDCEQAFRKTKELIVQHNRLIHYDPSKPLFLMCDASPYGLGAVLLQQDGQQELPVMFASTTLTPAEKNYAQLEREALALIFGVRRFHRFLMGRSFTLITDHRPLQFLFGENKGIPIQAAARVQRWALTLSSYNYHIQYRKASDLAVADALSRLPIPVERSSFICSFSFSDELPVSASDIGIATERDPDLREVLRYTQHGWPDRLSDISLKPYWSRRKEISIEQKCLLWGNRVIIPRELRPQLIQALHANHPGIVRMKMLARSYLWWPGLDSEIEEHSAYCTTCQRNQDAPPKSTGSWPEPAGPWERVHLDLAWIQGTHILTLADAYSKWIEVHVLKISTTEVVVDKLRRSFSYLGLPQTLVADNGPQFVSSDFRIFCNNNNIKLLHTPVYHPASNGQVERAIRTVKTSLKKRRFDHPGEDPERAVDEVLFSYRNIPSTSTGQSPASLIFKYKPRIHLDALRPTAPPNPRVLGRPESSPEYEVGQKVLVRTVRNKATFWWPAKILEVRSPKTYIISASGKTRYVHRDHLRPMKTDNNRGPADNS